MLPDEQMAEIGHRNALKRPQNSGFYVSVADARQDGRKVCASPTSDNPCHADIWLPEGCIDEKDCQMQHAIKLAGVAKFKKLKKED